jgi:predicted flavoprotein YhiN
MDSITESFELKTHPNVFVCGEMLDWDAPTGGYLIQGAVSTGFMVGNSI